MDPYDSEDEFKSPSVSVALEYVEAESIFNFYIKRISNAPILISYRQKFSRAVLYVVKGLNRTSWMGRPKTITWQDISSACLDPSRTLSVPRLSMTVFNEFFSCQMEKDQFHRTLLRIQLCDVDREDREVAIAECDYWIDTHSINTFKEFELPMHILKPDLGELELTTCYLPTAQRLCIERIKATNLKIADKADGIHVRVFLYTDGHFDEVHKTESKEGRCDPTNGTIFSKRLVFDLLRTDCKNVIIVVQAVEIVEEKKRVIGQFGLSTSSPGCDHALWRKTIDKPARDIQRWQSPNVTIGSIKTFKEFELPMNILKPDLGELEITTCYLPTGQRLCIERIKATNLKISDKAEAVHVSVLLFTDGHFHEVHKTESKEARCDPTNGTIFSKRLVSDLLRRDCKNAIIVVQTVEIVEKKKRVIGQFGLSTLSPGCDHALWRKTIDKPREKHSEIIRIMPGI